jgi:carboxyl-terminal processing protease
VGNPLGIGETVTAGIISARGRATGLSDGSFEDFLQTDAAINQGNSGGALVSARGELIGINSQIISPSGGNIGIGFAIPSNMARNVMDQLKSGGKVRRGRLGVGIQEITSDLSKSLGLREVRGVLVNSVDAGGPAEGAGIRAGDVIMAVDGKATDNMTTSDVADLVKGPRGSQVHISILREGVQKPLEFTVTRDEIPRHSVDVHFLVRPGIGYLHIGSFIETTDSELDKALAEFGNLNGLILDLRQDPGGLLKEAVSVADRFLPKGAVVVSQRGRSSPEVVYRAKNGNSGKEYPIVVLVNRGTASAAEIVSGAIQDHDRGLVLGENTFGKGLVQTVYPLSDHTGLALTTAKYYTPSGRLIQRKYTGMSLYDYYYGAGSHDSTAGRESKTTDSGRTVYGGDGITPDVKFDTPKANRFQTEMQIHYVFFDFAKRYLSNHQVAKNFTVDDQVLQQFREFLNTSKTPWTEADLQQNLDWVKSNIKGELFTEVFGPDAGLRAKAEADPEVVKALDLLPQAKQLTENARRIIAKRSDGAAVGKQ